MKYHARAVTRRVLASTLKASGLCVILFATALLPAAAPPEKPATTNISKPIPHLATAPGPVTRNTHLKGVEPHTHPARPTATVHKEHHAEAYHIWHHRWDFHGWIALHRGLGTIRGVIHTPAGAPLASARVALQHPGGRHFVRAAMKHATFTNANGEFVMFGVRTGRYRVFAQEGKQRGHVQTAVHPAGLSTVSIRV